MLIECQTASNAVKVSSSHGFARILQIVVMKVVTVVMRILKRAKDDSSAVVWLNGKYGLESVL